VRITLLLDKPAESDIRIQVIDTRITAIGESCTMQMNITQVVHNNEMTHLMYYESQYWIMISIPII